MKFASLLTHYFIHTRATKRYLALQRMGPSLLLSQSRLSLFTHHMGWDAQQLPHQWLGLAILMACQDLAADKVSAQTLINHIDTHHR
jgi:hypothetical protein